MADNHHLTPHSQFATNSTHMLTKEHNNMSYGNKKEDQKAQSEVYYLSLEPKKVFKCQ